MMNIPILRTASTIILHGGLVRISNPGSTVKYMPVNIALMRSKDWLKGTVILDKMSFYRLLPFQDYRIEIRNIKNDYFLTVNEIVIRQYTHIFGYTIHLDLNQAVTDKPYADFFKYY
jgi:hypothetical protein